ncbi:MAG: hypothetical protein Q4E22_03805 [Coriobacteriia bacterium]|nr:hypothetical protein [Coriobacteriia bacterium]
MTAPVVITMVFGFIAGVLCALPHFYGVYLARTRPHKIGAQKVMLLLFLSILLFILSLGICAIVVSDFLVQYNVALFCGYIVAIAMLSIYLYKTAA